MKKRTIDRVVIKRAAERATKQSAALERRDVPAGYVRSEETERYLAEILKRA